MQDLMAQSISLVDATIFPIGKHVSKQEEFDAMGWWSRNKGCFYMLWWLFIWIGAVVIYVSDKSKPGRYSLFNVDISGFVVDYLLIVSVLALFFAPYYVVSLLWPLV